VRAFQVEAPHKYGLVDIPVPEPGRGEVLVKVGGCGICASDVDVMEGVRPEFCTSYPCILGHEFAAQVERIGEGVTGLTVGDKVAVDTIVGCGLCASCQKGWTAHCLKGYVQLGFTTPGGMEEYVVVPKSLLFKLPDNIDLTTAALIEPLSCAAHGILKANVQPGQSVVIIGAGSIGAGALQIAALYSPLNLILVEVDERKLAIARKLGATHTINSLHEDVAERIKLITRGFGADAVVDCSGNLQAVQQSFRYIGTKARIVMVGVPEKAKFEIDFFAMLEHDAVFAASAGYTTTIWSWVTQLVINGYFDAQTIITHRFPLGEIDKAFAVLRDRRELVSKVMLIP